MANVRETYAQKYVDYEQIDAHINKYYLCRKFGLVDMFNLKLPHHALYSITDILYKISGDAGQYKKYINNANTHANTSSETIQTLLLIEKVGIYNYLKMVFDYFRLAYLQMEDAGKDLNGLTAQEIINEAAKNNLYISNFSK